MERSAVCASGFARLPRSLVAAPPIPRRFVLAGVNPRASRASRILFADVPPRIVTIRQGMALPDHPAVQVGAVRVTCPDCPSVLIPSAYTATDPASCDHPAERPGRVPAACPGRAIRSPAALVAFESIDSMKADPAARNFDGIAVNHRCGAFKHVRRTSCRHTLMTSRFPVRLADLVNRRSRRIGMNPCTFRYPEMAMVWFAAGMAAIVANFTTVTFYVHGSNESDGNHHAKRCLQPFHRLPLRCPIRYRFALNRCIRADADEVWPNGPRVAIRPTNHANHAAMSVTSVARTGGKCGLMPRQEINERHEPSRRGRRRRDAHRPGRLWRGRLTGPITRGSPATRIRAPVARTVS